jgi:hypothetical protein
LDYLLARCQLYEGLGNLNSEYDEPSVMQIDIAELFARY